MGFGQEDLRGELFNRLGVENESDPLKLIEQGVLAKEEGNNQGAKKAFQQAIEISSGQSEKYISQNQHRSAAESFYIQAIAHGHLDQPEKQSELYSKVIDSLLQAGENAMAFGENQRGIASVALAGMVAVMDNNEDRAFEIYNEYLNKSQEKENSAFLQKLLYSLGYILDALKNDNIAALTDAQNYISTDLQPMLSNAKLSGFDPLLDQVLEHTQDVLQSRITMPKLQIGTSLPRDIQFNQIFDLDLTVTNNGDGIASDVELKLEIPDDIEILDGQIEESFEKLESNQRIDRKLQLRFLTGDTSGEENRKIKGNVVYVDMLGNSHNQYFGPIEIVFTAVSKREEFDSRLKEILEPVQELTTDDLHENVLPGVFELFKSQIDKIETSIRDKIEGEQFDQVEFGLQVLETEIDQLETLTSENEITKSLGDQLEQLLEKEKQEQKETLEQEFATKKEEELNNLRQQKNKEMEDRVDQLKADLKEQHNSELNELKDKHQQEMQQIQQNHETKLKQALVQHENKLKDEFKKEKENLKDQHDQHIQELKSEHQEQIKDIKSNLREEVTQKYEQRIEELESSIENLKTELRSEHTKEKEEELSAQKEKLMQEKSEALKQKEEEISAQLKQEYEQKLEEKQAEIDRLRSQTND